MLIEWKFMREIVVERKTDGAKFEIAKKRNGKYVILRHKTHKTGETIKEQAYFSDMALYGKEEFGNAVQAYKYLEEWIDWFY